MCLVDKKVNHKVFGEGIIKSCDEKYLHVLFGQEEKIFSYPSVFEKFITIEDKEANDKIKGFEEKETELEELRAWKTTNEKVIEEQKPIIEKYKAQQEKHREELLETVSQGDSQLREQFESFSTENLETLVGMHVEEQPAHGVGADNAPGLNEGDGSNGKPTEEELKQKEADDALEFFKKLHNGETPSFLKQEGGE